MKPPSLQQKSLKLLTIFTFTFILSTSLFFFYPVAAQDDEYYHKSFAWEYDGNQWTWDLDIPKGLYDAYREVSVATRTRDGLQGYGFLTTTKDPYIMAAAEEFNESANQMGYGSFDQVSFVLAFVQSLPYTSDDVTTGHDEYPRFPIETLVDDGGDCEDTSILFLTIVQILGYDAVYINPPEHFAVGVLGDNLEGTYYTFKGETYYYCETTGDGFRIGDIPEEYADQEVYIITMNQRDQYVPDVEFVPAPEPTSDPTDSTTTTTPTPLNSTFDSSLFVLAVIFIPVVVVFIAVFAFTNSKKKQSLYPQATIPSYPQTNVPPAPPPPPLNDYAQATKVCVYCGASNGVQNVYCEQCGRRVG